MILQVESTAGLHGDPEPCAFLLGSRRLEIICIVDRWPAPGHSYFKVHASDDSIYILRYEPLQQQWQLTLFQAAAPSDSHQG